MTESYITVTESIFRAEGAFYLHKKKGDSA